MSDIPKYTYDEEHPPPRVCDADAHCYHPTGVFFTTYPARREEVCCNCGTHRLVSVNMGSTQPAGHGPYLPR